jgi:hypothetical protein
VVEAIEAVKDVFALMYTSVVMGDAVTLAIVQPITVVCVDAAAVSSVEADVPTADL